MRTLLIVFATACSLMSILLSPATPIAEETGQQIEIVIRNFTYEFTPKMLRPDQPVTLVLHNRDTVEHGLVSPLLPSSDVQVKSSDGTAFGRGIKGVHVQPGKSLSIQLIPSGPGQYRFECDIHPGMKGELLLLSVGTA
jgi:plastocyanin